MVFIFLFLFTYNLSLAKVVGDCSNCHTMMHTEELAPGEEITNELLNATCVNCHSHSGAETIKQLDDQIRIPIVYSSNEPENALAGGEILDQLDNPISSSYLLAESYYQIGDYDKAVKMLETLDSKMIRKYAPFHFLLSACYSQLGIKSISREPDLTIRWFESAIKACRSGLKLRPNQKLASNIGMK